MEKTFEFKGKTYIIVKEYKSKPDIFNWEKMVTDVIRERQIFAWKPWFIGKKFRWLKKIIIRENLNFVRYGDFDDGWTYQNYWKPWEMCWETIEILN